MELEYDPKDKLFRMGGKELFWSSMYLLERKRLTINDAKKEMEVSNKELDIFHSELHDLCKLGLIEKDYSREIVATQKGIEAARQAKKITSFSNLRRKAIDDIDVAESSIEKLLRMGIEKTKDIGPRRRPVDEEFNWGPFYLNVMMGIFFFLFSTALFYSFSHWQGIRIMATWIVLSPILSVFFGAVSVSFIAIMFHAGQAINEELFRR